MIYKRFSMVEASEDVDLRAKADDDPGVKWVIARVSSSSVDSEGDVLLPGGVDLSEFRKNPVIFFGHKSDTIPIGKAVGIKRRVNDIVAKIVFNERPASLPGTVEWPPDTIHALMTQSPPGIRGFSIGAEVMPGGIRKATTNDASRFGKGVQRVVTRWKLREISVVGLPANQDAVALAVSKGSMPRDGWVHRIIQATEAEADLDVDGANRLRFDRTRRLRL